MDIDGMVVELGEALDRQIGRMAPWLAGFAFVYFTCHVIVALSKGWL